MRRGLWIVLGAALAVIAGVWIYGILRSPDLQREWQSLAKRRRTELQIRILPEALQALLPSARGRLEPAIESLWVSEGRQVSATSQGIFVDVDSHKMPCRFRATAFYAGYSLDPTSLVVELEMNLRDMMPTPGGAGSHGLEYDRFCRDLLSPAATSTRLFGREAILGEARNGVRHVSVGVLWPMPFVATTPIFDRGYADTFYERDAKAARSFLATQIFRKNCDVVLGRAVFNGPGDPFNTHRGGCCTAWVARGEAVIAQVDLSTRSTLDGSNAQMALRIVGNESFEDALTPEFLAYSKSHEHYPESPSGPIIIGPHSGWKDIELTYPMDLHLDVVIKNAPQ